MDWTHVNNNNTKPKKWIKLNAPIEFRNFLLREKALQPDKHMYEIMYDMATKKEEYNKKVSKERNEMQFKF